MHPNPIFRKTGNEKNIEFASARGFGTLAVNAPSNADGQPGFGAPLLSHIPFVLNDEGTVLDAHLVRSNPILKLLDAPVPAAIAVNGPDSYISPDWYELEDQVPTWNYVAVHLRGTLFRLPDEELPNILDSLSSRFEHQLAPKTPWHRSKMTSEVFERMVRMIVPIRFDITHIDGTWKLSQNKPDQVRLNAADKVIKNGIGSEPAALAGLMKNSPD